MSVKEFKLNFDLVILFLLAEAVLGFYALIKNYFFILSSVGLIWFIIVKPTKIKYNLEVGSFSLCSSAFCFPSLWLLFPLFQYFAIKWQSISKESPLKSNLTSFRFVPVPQLGFPPYSSLRKKLKLSNKLLIPSSIDR